MDFGIETLTVKGALLNRSDQVLKKITELKNKNIL